MGLQDFVDVQINGTGRVEDGMKNYTIKVLQPNMVGCENVLTPEMLSAPDTKYVIRWNYVMKSDITIPEGCLLEFEGGSIDGNGHTITGNNTVLINECDDYDKVLKNMEMGGTWHESDSDADEEDLTDVHGKLKFKDKEYVEGEYTGLGRVYLRKNEGWLGLPFDKMLTPMLPITPSTGLTEKPDKIVFVLSNNGSAVNAFWAKKGTTYYSEWSYDNAGKYMGSVAYDGNFVCKADGKCYSRPIQLQPLVENPDGEKANILTQSMMNKANTIYVIQYDYDLNGETIEVPEGCVLKFEGGSLKNGEIVGDNTLLDGSVSLLNLTAPLTGSFSNERLESNWFGFKKNGEIEDELMSIFVRSGVLTRISLYLNKGEYHVASSIVVDTGNGFSLIGENKDTTIIHSHFEGENEALFYFVTTGYSGVMSKLSDISLQQDSSNELKGIGIKLGNEVATEDYSEVKYCGYITIENLWIIGFYKGIEYARTWNTLTNNVYVKYNYYGIYSVCTETYISNLWATHNVIGVYQTRLSNNEGNLSIHRGNIEQNAVGIVIESGYASITNTYIENNVPGEGNRGIYTEYGTLYPNGCECICGKTEEFVKVMSFIDCYFGRYNNRFGLFDFDKIECLNVIGTELENVITTSDTHLCDVFFPTKRYFNSNQPHYIKEKTSPSYPLSEIPIFFADDFSDWTLSGNVYSKYNFFIEKRTYGEFVVTNGVLRYNISNDDSDFRLLFRTHKSIFNSVSSATFRIRFKIGKRYKTIEVKGKDWDKIIDTQNNRYNYDAIHEVDIPAVFDGSDVYSSLLLSSYQEADPSEYFIEVYSVSIFDGYAYTSKGITKSNNSLYFAKTLAATDGIVIPTNAPSYIRNTVCYLYYNNAIGALNIIKPGNADDIFYSHIVCGSTRPVYNNNTNAGKQFYDTTIQKLIMWNGTSWVDADGNPADAAKSGTTSQRPSGVGVGYSYYDTDLKEIIFWNGSGWVLSDGYDADIPRIGNVTTRVQAAASLNDTQNPKKAGFQYFCENDSGHLNENKVYYYSGSGYIWYLADGTSVDDTPNP